MCEQARITSPKRGIWQLLSTTFSPLFILAMLQRGDVNFTLPVLLGALLLFPVAIVAHELGHALVGKLLRLEIGTIAIGFGPLVWRFEVRGLPVHVHAWPLCGFVYLGAETKTLLRTRAWLAIAAGPLTNVGLMVATGAYWSSLETVFGGNFLALWLIANALLFLSAIVPHQGNANGQPYRSDGLQLWDVPRASADHMNVYLSSALLMRGLSLFNASDYVRSKAVAERLLRRVPDSRFARIMISANTSHLGQHARTLEVLTPLVQSIDTLDAPTRAVVRNNVAFALTMSSAACRSNDEEQLRTAEELSAAAYSAYPCVLAYRNTRALVLVALGRPAEALELLQYVHYKTASPIERGHSEGVRAFALQRMGDVDASKTTAKAAIELNPSMDGILRTLMSPA